MRQKEREKIQNEGETNKPSGIALLEQMRKKEKEKMGSAPTTSLLGKMANWKINKRKSGFEIIQLLAKREDNKESVVSETSSVADTQNKLRNASKDDTPMTYESINISEFTNIVSQIQKDMSCYSHSDVSEFKHLYTKLFNLSNKMKNMNNSVYSDDKFDARKIGTPVFRSADKTALMGFNRFTFEQSSIGNAYANQNNESGDFSKITFAKSSQIKDESDKGSLMNLIIDPSNDQPQNPSKFYRAHDPNLPSNEI